MTRRPALYLRAATADQNAVNLVQQLERLHAYARERGWLVVPEQIYRDEGMSGLSLKRPALNRLRAGVARGDIDVVIATAPDRLARDAAKLSRLLDEFERAGVRVVFADQG